MKNYIFITQEGITYQPDSPSYESSSTEGDVDNCQVVGFAKGEDEYKALKRLLKENESLLDTNFNEIICIELKNEDHYAKSKYFYLNEYKGKKDK